MYKLSYEKYLDKVYGCFLGKTVYGTLGAPYEGIKMPMNLEFSQSMINTMKPNDDLDLQILWLEVVEKKGFKFTSKDLLEAFIDNCDYSPGEYAVMRKNYQKGIYPPYSGKFCNDFYCEGMGSPIRSEIWACISAGNPAKASEYAQKDAVIDHSGNSVYAEQFLAALEAAAFFENDLDRLIETGLEYVPTDSRIYGLIRYAVALSKECDEYNKALFLLLKKYGHPDCTNLFENIGITILSLYFGGGDFIKANMLALNSGFDTDCTCATIGSIMGIISGATDMIERYQLADTRFVLSVKANRRSDSVFDLSEDIAKLGVLFAESCENQNLIMIENAPTTAIDFEAQRDITINVKYANDFPSIEIGGTSDLTIVISNHSDKKRAISYELISPEYIMANEPKGFITIDSNNMAQINICLSIDKDTKIVYEKNQLTFNINEDNKIIATEVFGISCATPWKSIGPFWKTYPCFTDDELLNSDGGYFSLFKAMSTKGEQFDLIRGYHINFHLDDEKYVSDEMLFAPFDEKDYRQEIINIHEDSFFLDNLYKMQGPTTGYLSRKLISDEDIEVCLQIGFTDPFKIWINGNLVSKSDNYEFFTSENLHVSEVKLNKGINTILVRFTKTTVNAKFSLIFSKEPSCAEHFTCFGSKNPEFF